MSLASLSQLKVLLSVPLGDVTKDSILQGCLDGAEEVARDFTKRPGLKSPPVAYTNIILDGTGTFTLRLPHYPVGGTGITLYEDLAAFGGTNPAGAFANAPLVEGYDYYLKRDDPTGTYLSLSGVVTRIRSPNLQSVLGISPMGLPYGTLAGGSPGPIWPAAVGSVKVACTAGFLAGQVPNDLSTAVCEIAAWIRRNAQYGGMLYLASESLGAYSYSVGLVPLQQAPELGSARQILSRYRDRPL